MKSFFIIISIVTSSFSLWAQTLHVPQNYPTIQSAINAAQDGDTVLVARNRYFENIDFEGKGIVVASNFIFSRNVEDIDSTIIDGSQPYNSDSSSCVLMYKSNQSFADDTSAALIGFTLTGGNGTVWEDEHGLGNFYREGGGILIQYWAPKILFNVIIENEAYDKTGVISAGGGAIRCGDGNPLISNNIILQNRARYGAGIVLNYSGAQIKNNLIGYNYGGEDYAGSGIWIYGNRYDNRIKVIENNTIVNNASLIAGGGIFLWYANGNIIRNNIIWGNTAPSNPQIRIQQSTGQIIFNDVEGGWNGEGNIDLNPEFEGYNFYLSDNSPSIDAGKDSLIFNDPENPENLGFALWPSKGTIRNDMGAYGGPSRTNLPQIITSVKNEDGRNKINNFILYQNYPNPFNPVTKINFTVPPTFEKGLLKDAVVSLKVFDVLGKEIVTLVNEEKSVGNYEVNFDASGLPSGIYFYRLRTTGLIETKKMILLK